MLSSTDTSGLGVDANGALVNGANYAVIDTGTIDTMSGSSVEHDTLANGNYLAMIVYDAENGLYGISDAALVQEIIDNPPTAGSLDGRVFQNDPEGYMVANMATAVPEPTSGLLLLLGVAGLALRRRRA